MFSFGGNEESAPSSIIWLYGGSGGTSHFDFFGSKKADDEVFVANKSFSSLFISAPFIVTAAASPLFYHPSGTFFYNDCPKWSLRTRAQKRNSREETEFISFDRGSDYVQDRLLLVI